MPRRTSRGVVFTGVFVIAAACSTKGSNGTDTASVTSQIPAADSTRAHDSAQAATAAGVDTAWRALFDGTSTSAWHKYKGGPVPPQWKVADGTLTATPGGGDIVTNDQFGNFELEV